MPKQFILLARKIWRKFYRYYIEDRSM